MNCVTATDQLSDFSWPPADWSKNTAEELRIQYGVSMIIISVQ